MNAIKNTTVLWVSVILLLLFSTDVMGNGGPTDFSNTLGSGNIIFYQYRNIKLVSEKLTITPGFKFVDVEARYLLQSTTETDSVDYAFPVDIISSNYLYPNHGLSFDEEVPYFDMTLNGEPLEYEVRFMFDNDNYTNSYMEDFSVHRILFITKILIEPEDTVELVVNYQFKAFFSDIWVSKNFFTIFENRFFHYQLDPAGYWGDGIVEKLNIEFDFTEVMANGGDPVDLPDGGEWLNNTHYVISEENYSMHSADPLEITYDVSEWGKTDELLDLSLKSNECEITASSTLGDNYSVNNLLDGDLTTAWSEGVEGCRDQWVEINLNQAMYVGGIGIVSGYTKNQSTYDANAMPEIITVEIFGLDGEVCFKEKVLLEDPIWEDIENETLYSKTQFLYLSGNGYETTRIRLSFDSVYLGDSYDDLCISELFIAGWNWE